MIIEAKSSKVENSEEKGAERFQSGPERLTRLPIYFAMAVITIATYFKAAFQGHAATTSMDPMPDPLADDHGAPVNWCLPGAGPSLASIDEAVDDIVTGSIGKPAGPGNQLGRGPSWPNVFVEDHPAFVFAVPYDFVGPSLTPFFPGAFAFGGVNDNAPNHPPGSVPASPVLSPTIRRSDTISDPSPVGDRGNSRDDEDNDGEVEDDDDADDSPGALNRTPVVLGPVRLNDVFAGQVALIGLSQLLFGASDPDGDALEVRELKATGAILVKAQDGWLVRTEPGMLGPVTLTYTISDGEASITQTASLDIVRKQHLLTPRDDVYVASPYDDDIDALAGDDTIDALAGNDLVSGGDGDDHIYGGDGDDHLFGGNGNDVIMGGGGNDQIFGDAGDDRLFGDDGDDIIYGGLGDDRIFGGAGNDIAEGGDGDDTLLGEAGDDVLAGGDGCDLLEGGDGADILLGEAGDDRLAGGHDADLLNGGEGDDELDGGAGDDTLDGGAGCDIVNGGAGNDRLLADQGDDRMSGGEGDDLLDYSAARLGVVFDMAEGNSYSAEFGRDSFEEIESVAAGSGNDMFVIGATATVVSGGRGQDTFVFEVTDEAPVLSEDLVHDILDFVVGDRIRVRDYEIDRAAEAMEEETFRRIYDDDDDAWLKSDLPVVVQHVRYDDVDSTIIKADLNRDAHFEVTIFIHGVQLPIDPSISVA